MSLPEWSVLVTVAQAAGEAPITPEQQRELLDALPGGDKWLQYPPASGRGHGFETRWWEHGTDAGNVGAEATDRYLRAVAAAGLRGIEIVLVHVASAADRLNESVIGLERRQGTAAESTDWNVMLRAVPAAGAGREFQSSALHALLDRLGDDASGTARTGLVEVRSWVRADDAADATAVAAAAFGAALAALGRPGWQVVRAHATSVAEATRAAYIGVERRVLEADAESLEVMIRR